ncbi:IclR family transcriptional regulator [Planktotalea frisia]|jgi:DNA-binding IclR family transcriptional regulator|uniref:Pca regulon regulatory protein n=1 Tax=Planktotalea frisia TaxID=696762 RepID=A0A1L9NTZ0_9RHOB|nr:IclR family transcriptional regulator [Planktotalea frisia]OJI92786.1 Pca regulon regulatory protein [Planktotalea frisia]PZX24590.1 IclR family transcriptional regulator [Planktotalea frisia]
MADDLRDDEATKDRNFVTALARGLELLSCFRDGEVTLTNSDFSDRTGLPKATISRLTYTLCELGYLIADLRTGTYRLGAAALNLGFSVLSGIDIQDLAQKEMAQLRDGPNSYITVALGEVYQLEVVYVATSNSLEGVALVARIGSRLPLFPSAIGQSILVGMRDDAREAVFEYAGRQGAEIEAEGRKRHAEAKSIYESKGFCTGYGIWRKDVNGIAAPVFSMSGDRVYGLNLGGPSFRVKPKQLESVYAPRLIKAANALSMHPHR